MIPITPLRLSGGDLAVALFNRGPHDGAMVSAAWQNLGLPKRCVVRDGWNNTTLGEHNGWISLPVASHGARLLMVSRLD